MQLFNGSRGAEGRGFCFCSAVAGKRKFAMDFAAGSNFRCEEISSILADPKSKRRTKTATTTTTYENPRRGSSNDTQSAVHNRFHGERLIEKPGRNRS
jgi:hypothetical protein